MKEDVGFLDQVDTQYDNNCADIYAINLRTHDKNIYGRWRFIY
jgi:hypothetical protein